MDDLQRPRLVAQRLLRWWDDVPARADDPARAPASPATPVDDLAAALGLEVTTFHPGARRGGALGWLEPGEDLIFLRDELPEPVRRFTLAHEIGHALLHRATGAPAPISAALDDAISASPAAAMLDDDVNAVAADTCDDGDLGAPLDPLGVAEEALRPGQAYSARARRESEANAFAAALLLPPETLRPHFLGDADTPAMSPRQLAERFGVSEDTVHQAL